MKEVTKKRMSAFWKEKWQDKEWKQKIIENKIKRGILQTQRNKMFEARKEKGFHKLSDISKKKMSKSMKEWWNNHPEAKLKMSKIHKGKKLSPEHKKAVGFKGRKHTEETKKKIGAVHWGKIQSKETKEKLRQYFGEKASGWMGGLSFEPYSYKFNKSLKNKIIKRDDFRCFLCGKKETKMRRRLSVHHIDYDKKNCSPKNLISLCNCCHVKTNINRDLWQKVFYQIIGDNYGI